MGRVDKVKSENVYVTLYLLIKCVSKGDKDRALHTLTSDMIKLAKIDHIFSGFRAPFHSILGLKEEAIK